MTRRDFFYSLVGITAVLFARTDKLLSQEETLSSTAKIFSEIITHACRQKWHSMDISDLISRIAVSFVDTPYVAGTLDRNEVEEAVVNLEELDCVTFVENSLCIARCIKKQHFRFSDLVDEVIYTRYRDGNIGDYTTRLHYTSEWIINNIKKGVVEDITESLGGTKHKFNINFMSNNIEFYPALQNNKQYIQKIKNIEEFLSEQTFFVIYKRNIKSVMKKLRDGDIILIATSAKGLDYSHIGLLFNRKMLHASSKHKKVLIDKSLDVYIRGNKKAIGITVLRPIAL